MNAAGHIALALVIGFGCGVFLMDCLYERRERRRRVRRERLARGEYTPWRVPVNHNPPPPTGARPEPPGPPPMRVIREGIRSVNAADQKAARHKRGPT